MHGTIDTHATSPSITVPAGLTVLLAGRMGTAGCAQPSRGYRAAVDRTRLLVHLNECWTTAQTVCVLVEVDGDPHRRWELSAVAE